ncbi:hypothetical protein N7478_010977 [Penicillium angulare]|uniref:uncharacterized protein n=1 Tax=Penicillium angulare TaxID=116970 RepID=UPI0025409E91|nr:uncharacterized protein N7478_010977 [Penicillium angulare]KAJ5263372.1 hypothetical protein N7478_010977 [Penicillium angulare]
MTSVAHNVPDIPLELWREILFCLANQDIKSVRLASNQFSIAVELNFSRVFLSPKPLNIEVFRAIADHDTFRHQVKK